MKVKNTFTQSSTQGKDGGLLGNKDGTFPWSGLDYNWEITFKSILGLEEDKNKKALNTRMHKQA